jgi:hypothetical protein
MQEKEAQKMKTEMKMCRFVEHDIEFLPDYEQLEFECYMDACSMHPDDKKRDCFKPPRTNRKVKCEVCGTIFRAFDMKYEKRINEFGEKDIFSKWYCTVFECSGFGYDYQIIPVIRKYVPPRKCSLKVAERKLLKQLF